MNYYNVNHYLNLEFLFNSLINYGIFEKHYFLIRFARFDDKVNFELCNVLLDNNFKNGNYKVTSQ